MHMRSLSLEDTQADEDAEDIQPRNLQPELDKAFLVKHPKQARQAMARSPECIFVQICLCVHVRTAL